eukprot:2226016-Rhodomonas_salina.2
MPGTDLAYAATSGYQRDRTSRLPVLAQARAEVKSATCRRTSFALPGTGLRARYGKPGTDGAYGATPRRKRSSSGGRGTGALMLTTVESAIGLCDVRY